MNVPQEVLSAILSHLPSTELKTARHVCKALEAAAVPHLFNEIFIVARYAQMERATLLASRFRPFVKTLIWCSEFLELDGPYSSHEVFSTITNSAIYRKLLGEQEELLTEGEFRGYLCSTLTALPNLQKIILRRLYSVQETCLYKEIYDVNCSRMFNPWSIEDFAAMTSSRSQSEDSYTNSFEELGPNIWKSCYKRCSLQTTFGLVLSS